MPEFAAITPERHAKKGWKNTPDYAFAAKQTVVQLVGAELSKTVSAMPIGFIKQEVGYQLVAFTSLQDGLNLYVTPDGKWLGPYIPAALRAYPFRLAQQEKSDKSILCINEASGLVTDSTEEGNAFFDEQNEPTQAIKDVLSLLSEIEANLVVTQAAVKALDDAGLIAPWELNLMDGEDVVPVTGLFKIDEEAMNNLDDEAFLTLRKTGGFAIAYAQLLSMNQLAVLERLGKLRGQILAQQQTSNSGNGSLEGFSLSENEGTLMFD